MSISPASPKQRTKVYEEHCIYCGKNREQEKIDPAHLWDRSRGGCDDPLCVVPLCRTCHRKYDDKILNLLPVLITFHCFDEMAHVISAHQVSPYRLTARLTGEGL